MLSKFLQGNYFQPGILYPEQMFFQNEGKIKTFQTHETEGTTGNVKETSLSGKEKTQLEL